MSLSCNLTESVITRHYTYFNGKKLGQRYKHNGHIGNHSTPEVKIKISIDHQTIRLVIYDKFWPTNEQYLWMRGDHLSQYKTVFSILESPFIQKWANLVFSCQYEEVKEIRIMNYQLFLYHSLLNLILFKGDSRHIKTHLCSKLKKNHVKVVGPFNAINVIS